MIEYTMELQTVAVHCRPVEDTGPVGRAAENFLTAFEVCRGLVEQHDPDVELFGWLATDTRHRVMAVKVSHVGTRTSANVDIPKVLRELLFARASAFIVFHTHTGGETNPSADDLALTRRLFDAGELVGVSLHDHLILSPRPAGEGYTGRSLRDDHPEAFGRIL